MSDTFPDYTAFLTTISILPQLPQDTSVWVWWKDGDDDTKPLLVRRLDDRRYVGIMPLIYTHAVIWGYVTDAWGYEDRWCYHDAKSAIAAASRWGGTGEPEGWHRHPATGRRRPDGDPNKEYVNL